MDDFERAVMLSLDPAADPVVRRDALVALQAVSHSANGWRFALGKLVSGRVAPAQVHFYCLQVVVDALRLVEPSARDEVRQTLVPWVYRLADAAPETTTNTEILPAPPYLKNKVAEAIAICVECDYPTGWRGAFNADVFGLVGAEFSPGRVDMFFRVIRAVDEMLTSREAPLRVMRGKQGAARANDLRDAMREDCILPLVALWKKLLGYSVTANEVAVTIQVLDGIRRYVEWIDIALVVDEVFVSVIYSALLNTSTPQQPQPPAPPWGNGNGNGVHSSAQSPAAGYRGAAAAALNAILTKRMDSQSKLRLMEALRIQLFLEQLPAVVRVEQSHDSTHTVEEEIGLRSTRTEMAALATRCATEALDCLSTADARAVAIVSAALPVVLIFVTEAEEDDDDTVAAALDFVAAYISMCRQNPTVDHAVAGMNIILKTIGQRAVFPENFDPTDDTAAFAGLRQTLLVLFQNIVRSSVAVPLRFVQEVLSAEDSSADASPARTELAMQMLMRLMEMAPEDRETLETVSWVLGHPPRCLTVIDPQDQVKENQRLFASRSFFELCARAYRVVLGEPRLLLTVMPPFFDNRGLRHPRSQWLRLRVAHLLLKLVRPVRQVLVTNCFESVIEAILPILGSTIETAAGDLIMLYEVAGLVLGCSSAPAEGRRYFPVILAPLREGLEAAKSSEKAGLGARYITAAGLFSKGFGGSSTATASSVPTSPLSRSPSQGTDSEPILSLTQESKALWKRFLQAALEFYTVHKDEGTRAALMILLHRMVDTLHEDVLPLMKEGVPLLLTSAGGAEDLSTSILLIDQAACKFKSECFELVNGLFLPLVQRVFEFSGQVGDGNAESEEVRESLELRKRYFTFLHVLVTNELSRVLVSRENGPYLKSVLLTVLAGASGDVIELRSPTNLMKLCLMILSGIVDAVSHPEARHLHETHQFLVEQVGVACLAGALNTSVFPKSSSYQSATGRSTIGENAALQVKVVGAVGVQFADYLRSTVLPRYGVPAEALDEYWKRLCSGDALQFQPFFMECVQSISRSVRVPQR